MPVYRLGRALAFPEPSLADESGLLAVGGDLSPARLVLAYANGIFPWYDRPPILWWCPPTRPVLDPARIHVPRSLRKTMRKRPFHLSLDTAFARVIHACARVPRPGQRGTWITPEMERAYVRLHEEGLAHSCEAWRGEELVGGVYGVALGGAFFGESMFSLAPDASKVALVTLCRQLARWEFGLFDCQVTNPHTERFGTTEISRREFLERVRALCERPWRRGAWELDEDLR